MNQEKKQTLKSIAITFATIFISNAFVITASFFLFFHSIELDSAQIPFAARITFGNVLFLTVLFMTVHLLRNYITVTRPVRRIRQGLEKITDGDFSVRMDPTGASAAFDSIIESVNRMTEELSSVETLKTDFVSNVSHEIKTPISVIQNYATLLQAEGLSAQERQEYSGAIAEAALRLNALVSNILRLNRLENQRLQPVEQTFDLSVQLTECLLAFESIWEGKQIDLAPEIEESVLLRSDVELLSVVWNNLFSNAFKFTESGGTVGVALRCENGVATVTVRDTGCGMPPETLRHIFDKFYQGDTSHATQGNGLGLTLVKRILDMIDGEILVNSVPGKGSEFTVRLKAANANAPDSR